MRAVKAKLNRRKAEAASRPQSSGLRLNSHIFAFGGLGKTVVAGEALRHMTKPRGTWKEYWPRLIRNISEHNRLPRGFKEPKEILLFDKFDSTQTTLRWSRP